MYHYVTDKAFLKAMRCCCSDIVNQLKQRINHDTVMEVEIHLIGSGAKNLITQNENQPIDLDYNLHIIYTRLTGGREIKEYIRKQFDDILESNGWGSCQDSTSALTTRKRYLKKGSRTRFSIDLAIVRRSNGCWQRLIHRKTGFVNMDEYMWQDAPNSIQLEEKVDFLKQAHWLELREVYLDKKNMYLCRNDINHPSFVVYVEAVNEVYFKYNLFVKYRQRIISLQIRR